MVAVSTNAVSLSSVSTCLWLPCLQGDCTSSEQAMSAVTKFKTGAISAKYRWQPNWHLASFPEILKFLPLLCLSHRDSSDNHQSAERSLEQLFNGSHCQFETVVKSSHSGGF